jgi:hypothetical protein
MPAIALDRAAHAIPPVLPLTSEYRMGPVRARG